MDSHWLDKVQKRIIERNEKETYPFTTIYKSNYDLWRQNFEFKTVLTYVSCQMALLHHELMESTIKNDFEHAVSLATNKLYIMEEELRSKVLIKSVEPSVDDAAVLCRLINDQKSKILSLEDQLALTNIEMKSRQDRILELEVKLNDFNAANRDKTIKHGTVKDNSTGMNSKSEVTKDSKRYR